MRVSAGCGATASVAAAWCSALALGGGFDASGVVLLGNIPLNGFPSNPNRGNDCWGYVSPSGREYALMGLNNALAVVEVTDPVHPATIQSFSHPASVWCDVKTYQHWAYIVTDQVGVGIQVIDLDNVDSGVVTLVNQVTGGGQTTNHNVVVDNAGGYLYTCGANAGGGRLMAFSLANPASPTFVSQINDAGSAYCHDAEVITYTSGPYAGKQIAFCCNGGTGLDIYDVTNKAAMVRLSRSIYPSLAYTHQCWVSDDRHYVYVDDELDNINRTTIFDITDLAAPVLLGDYTSGEEATDHNVYLHDGFIYEADYREGLRIFCAADPENPVPVGYFDTYPEGGGAGFEAAWSVYPFFPSGNVIVSDRERGLFVLDVSGALSSGGLAVSAPQGLPALVDPAGGTTVTVEATGSCGGTPAAGTGLLHYDPGDGFVEVPMSDPGPGSYQAEFPPLPCGADVLYYFSVQSDGGGTFTLPAGAPAETFRATAGSGLTPVLVDAFEADTGWTTSFTNATSGYWQRGVPVNDPGYAYDPPADADGSGQCWLTGNAPGESDVDAGFVVLTSPLLDMSSGDLVIGYDYYLNLPTNVDPMRVEISVAGDAGPWVELARYMDDGGLAWRHDAITPGMLAEAGVTPTATVKVRFTAGDLGPDNIVEAGLDGFRLDAIDCQAPIPGDVNGDGHVDTIDFLALLAAWGPNPGHPADIDGNGIVDTVDFLILLANWG